MIVVDMITLEEIVAELGFEGRFDPEEASHPLSIKVGNDGGGMWISEDMLGRIGMECASPRWITKNGIETFLQATPETLKVLDGDLAVADCKADLARLPRLGRASLLGIQEGDSTSRHVLSHRLLTVD